MHSLILAHGRNLIHFSFLFSSVYTEAHSITYKKQLARHILY